MKDHTCMAPVLMFNQICAHYVTDQQPLLHCGLKLTGGTRKEKTVFV